MCIIAFAGADVARRVEPVRGQDPVLQQVMRRHLTAAGFDVDLVAAALTQSRLRAKGHEKFGDFADGMLFTADGLEQATRLGPAG